ncbi:hypothetical protein HELRODRAFT_176397 [Helobdella robusta]|uniref:WSC domain-containing protein n=1 Tax=Helobdella robusta TaxID=6412 RepID=T1FAH2_HELRO|nr:hypothetical protein HELRODRAFT_176397 [Helobdella robusta]ESO00087.1 hypothetical protein HELRODRAFT_176397 [Helobdella robusta]
MALRNGDECYCVNDFDSAVASSECNTPCINNKACGGSDSYSVYKIKPAVTHHGILCTTSLQFSPTKRPIEFKFESIESCIKGCLELNKNFAARKGERCICFIDLIVLSPNITTLECNEYCSHDPTEICNCHYRDRGPDCQVIYFTRLKYEFQRSVSTYSHCQGDKNSYEVKECLGGGCSEGWKGYFCRLRDCTSNNGDCGSQMKCIESIVNGFKLVECVCPHGTVRNRWLQCETIRKNLALDKPVYLSSTFTCKYFGLQHEKHLTDGVIDGVMGARINDINRAWITVDLEESYRIGFVRVFNRIWFDSRDRMYMNSFVVKLASTFDYRDVSDVRSSLVLCGHGPNISTLAGQPVTVICNEFDLASRYVILQQTNNLFAYGSTSAAELQIYEADCNFMNGKCKGERCRELVLSNKKIVNCRNWRNVDTIVNPILACFKFVDAEYSHNEFGLSYRQCEDVCESRNYTLLVLTAGINCSCGKTLVAKGKTSLENCKKQFYNTSLIFHHYFMEDTFFNVTEDDLPYYPIEHSHTIVSTAAVDFTITTIRWNSTVSKFDKNGTKTDNIILKYLGYIIGASAVTLFLLLITIAILVKRKKQKNQANKSRAASGHDPLNTIDLSSYTSDAS